MQVVGYILLFGVLVAGCVGGSIIIVDEVKGAYKAFKTWQRKRQIRKWFKWREGKWLK